MRTPTLIAFALLLAACAKSPDSITAVTAPVGAFSGLSCAELAKQKLETSAQLEEASVKQRRTRQDDTFSVLFIGVPMSSVAGNDQEASIASLKGHLDAISGRQVEQGCPAGAG